MQIEQINLRDKLDRARLSFDTQLERYSSVGPMWATPKSRRSSESARR
jgi:hypothetical protein